MDEDEAFTALGRRACPPVGEALCAIAATWRPVSWPELDSRLDGLARPLFGAGPTGRERAGALAERLIDRFRPDPVLVDALWLDVVLASGRGHPLLLASVATELGRRAGWNVMVCSSPDAWFAGLLEDGVLWLVDPTGEAGGARSPTTVHRHCAHEVAFAVLTGLAERFTRSDDQAQARRLRERLDVFSP